MMLSGPGCEQPAASWPARVYLAEKGYKNKDKYERETLARRGANVEIQVKLASLRHSSFRDGLAPKKNSPPRMQSHNSKV